MNNWLLKINGVDKKVISQGDFINFVNGTDMIISWDGLNVKVNSTAISSGSVGESFYTKTELDGGQLDNRYYTEDEINTWRNEVTQEEMGWLHGITSDVQAQITARVIIGANPLNDRLCTWSSVTTIQGEANLTFDGTVLTTVGGTSTEWNTAYDHSQDNSQAHTDYMLNTGDTASGTYEFAGEVQFKDTYTKFYSTEVGKTDWRLTFNITDADIPAIYNYDGGETAYMNMRVGGLEANSGIFIDKVNTRVGIFDDTPSYGLDVNGTGRYVGLLKADASIEVTGDLTVSGLAGNERLVTVDAAGKLISEANLTFDGSELVNKTGYYKQYSTEAGKTDWRLTIRNSDADLSMIYSYDEGESAFKNFVLGNDSNFLYLDIANTRVGVGITGPQEKLHVYGATGSVKIEAETGDGSVVALKATNTEGSFAWVADGNTFYVYDYSDTAVRLTINGDGKVGINDSSPSYKLDVNGTGRFTGNLYGDANVQHLSFTSGWQIGTNWQITSTGDAEFRNMKITGGLEVYELILNRLHYQCGGLIIGAGGGKISEVVSGVVGSETLFFEDPEENNMIPFTVGAIVMIQDFDLDRTTVVKRCVRQVSALTDVGGKWRVDLTTTAGAPANVGTFAAGDELVAIGHVSNGNLDASLYLSAVDSNNPFLRILDDVNSWADWNDGANATIKLQIGNLESLAGYDIVPATPGYGLYSTNAYLSGTIVSGGDEHKTDDYSTTGITLAADGSIHTPNFYVNVGGPIGLREIEEAKFIFTDQGNPELYSAMQIVSSHMYETYHEDNNSAIHINYFGFEGGSDYFRRTIIGNGKGAELARFDGQLDKLFIYGDLDVADNLICPTISGNVSLTGILTVTDYMNVKGIHTTAGCTTYSGFSRIDQAHTNNAFYVQKVGNTSGEDMIARFAYGNETVNLGTKGVQISSYGIKAYYEGAIKLATTATGVDVTGNIRSTEVKIWNCAGVHFDATSPALDNVTKNVTNGYVSASADDIDFIASVSLPNGAIISAVEVFGNSAASAETWSLIRRQFTNGTVGSVLATAVINTEDTSISDATIDNDTYYYFFKTTTLDLADKIYGARITYTL